MLNSRYQLVKLLGQSQLGQTWLAVDRVQTSLRQCVIKQIRHRDLALSHAEAATRFQTITQLLSGLQYSQLPAWLDAFELKPLEPGDSEQGLNQPDGFCWVQEYISGDSLATLLEQQDSFEEPEIWQLLTGLLPVLHYLHSQGIIHGDIKPENIISCSAPNSSIQNSSVQNKALENLILVGSATVELGLGLAAGSPEYAAPEQVRGQPQFVSDLFSLGLTSVHLLTGVRPLVFATSESWTGALRQWCASGSTQPYSERLIQFLERLISPDLTIRYASAGEAIAALERLRGQKISLPVGASPRTCGCLLTLTGHQGLFAGVNAVAISPDGSTLVSASDDKSIRLWQLPSGKSSGQLLGHTGFVKTVTFHPEQPLLASGSHDRTIKLWDWQTQQELRTLIGHGHAVNSLTFADRYLVSGSSDKTVRLWELDTGKCVAVLSGHRLGVNAVAYSADSNELIASASSDGTICLWHLPTKNLLHTLTDHRQAVRAVAFSSISRASPPENGQWLASGGEDKTIRLWDVHTGTCQRTLSGHPWSVAALIFMPMFTPDQSYLLSASWDKTIKLWQMQTETEIAVFMGHTDSVNSIAISPDGTLLASAGKDRTVKLWKLPFAE
jgi:WD40 repeat protein